MNSGQTLTARGNGKKKKERNRNREKREKMTKRVFERIDEKVKKGECERLNEKH